MAMGNKKFVPVKPGPQPENQLAATLEEQLERVHRFVAVEAERIVRITSKAVLIVYQGHEQWIPRKCLRASDYFKMGDTWIALEVDRSFAKKEGLW